MTVYVVIQLGFNGPGQENTRRVAGVHATSAGADEWVANAPTWFEYEVEEHKVLGWPKTDP